LKMIANELKNGMVIEVEGNLYSVVQPNHVKPGKGPAYVRCKLKDIERAKIVEKTFRSTEKVTAAVLEEKKVDYLYRKGDQYYFMDLDNFEEVIIDENFLKEKKGFLKESSPVTLLKYQGKLIDVLLPTFIDLKVVKAEPGVKGNTVSAAKKRITLETGLSVEVPLFVNNGDLLRIDTRTGKYVTRI
ncbi:MAG: elongation factor P, partial [bacterium (Candidatus Ratteibacteria) CG01_land_8_20_14_3_00_40_19]